MALLNLSTREKELIRHCVGFDRRHKTTYRNHFVVGPGDDDYETWMGLVKRGLAHHRDGNAISGGMDVFWVSRETAEAVRKPDEHLDRDFKG